MAFIKIQANQGTIGANQNLMDFEVPSYVSGVDMSESFIDIAYEITHDADTHGAGTTVHNFINLFNGAGNFSSSALFNSSLVRTAVLSTARGGQLESIQRSDLISQMVQQYSKDIGDVQGESHHQIATFPNQFNYGSSSTRNLVVDGSVLSTEREGVMRVNLKDFLGLGKDILNLDALGAMRLHIETNLNKLTPFEVPTSKTDATDNPDEEQTTWTSETAIASGQPATTSLEFSIKGTELQAKKNCPWWTGQLVSFLLLQADGSAVTTAVPQNVYITRLEWLAPSTGTTPPDIPSGQKVKIHFSRIFATGNMGAAMAQALMFPIPAANPAYVFKGAELVVKTVNNAPMAKGMRYRTYTAIQDFAAATTSLQRTYEISRDAVGSLVCFDTSTSSTNFSYSWDKDVDSYHMFVNNVGQTDRPVAIQVADPRIKDPLHNIMLEKTLEEMGVPYKNNLDTLPTQMLLTTLTPDHNTATPPTNTEIYAPLVNDLGGVLALPVLYEADGAPKLLTMNISKSQTGEKFNLVIFNMVERTINY